MKTMLDRGAGILMPVSSLPSPYGIGTFGKAAYEFVDFLKKARQKYWQVLPVGPTSYGDSPWGQTSNKRVKVSRIVTSDPARAQPIHITTESGGALGWTAKANLQVVSDQ